MTGRANLAINGKIPLKKKNCWYYLSFEKNWSLTWLVFHDEPCINFLSFALSNDNKFLNLSLGDPGYLNIILQGPARATLARGGLYNYFEETGSCQTLEHLKRQLQYNTIRQPFWLSTYDVVQEDIDKDNKN